MVDQSKVERQKELSERWFNSSMYGAADNCLGGIKAPPGFGKTRIAIEHIIPKCTSATVVVPLDVLRRQWKRIVKNWGYDNVDVYTVHELIARNENLSTDLLIVDEPHLMYRSDLGARVQYINGDKIRYNKYLWLDGTPFDKHGRHDEIMSFAPMIGEVTEEEALEKNWIAQRIIVNLCLEMDVDNYNKYKDISENITKEIEKFGDRGFSLILKVLNGGKDANNKYYPPFKWALAYAKQQGYHPNADPEVKALWNPNKIMGYAKRCMQLIQARKHFLWERKEKIEAATKIITNLGLKAISFSRSTIFCDMLVHEARSKGIKAAALHSNIESQRLRDANTGDYIRYKSGKKKGEPRIFGKKKITDHILEQFSKGNLDLISSGIGINTGLDDRTVRLGINSSYTGNKNDFTQSVGRIGRFTSESEPVLFVNLYMKGTIEERWLKNAISGTNKENIYWVAEVDEVDFNLPENYFL